MKVLKVFAAFILVFVLTIYICIKTGKLDIIAGAGNWESTKDISIINGSPRQTLYSFLNSRDTFKLNGKKIFFNSGGLTCGACWRELPVLNKLHDQYLQSNVAFISSCDDISSSSMDSILNIHGGKKLLFQKVDCRKGVRLSLKSLASESQKKAMPKVDAVPLNIIIDENDSIVFISSGLNEKDVAEINRILQ